MPEIRGWKIEKLTGFSGDFLGFISFHGFNSQNTLVYRKNIYAIRDLRSC